MSTAEDGSAAAKPAPAARGARRAQQDRELTAAARLWAREQGMEVPTTGPVAPGVIAAYRRHNPRLDRTGTTDRF